MLIRALCVGMLLTISLPGCVKVGTVAIEKVPLESLTGQTKAQLIARFGSPSEELLEYANGQTRVTWEWSYVQSIPFQQVLPVILGVTVDHAGVVVSVHRKSTPPLTYWPSSVR